MIVNRKDNNPLNPSNEEISGTILTIGALAGITRLAFKNEDTLMSKLLKREYNRQVVKAASDMHFKQNRVEMQEMNKEDFMAEYNKVLESDINLNPTDDIVQLELSKITYLESELERYSGRRDLITPTRYGAIRSHALTNWDVVSDNYIPIDILQEFNKDNSTMYTNYHEDLLSKSREYRSKYVSSLIKKIRRERSKDWVLSREVPGRKPGSIRKIRGAELGAILDTEIAEQSNELLKRGSKIIQPDQLHEIVSISSGINKLKNYDVLDQSAFSPYKKDIELLFTALDNLKWQSDGKIDNIAVNSVTHNGERRLRVTFNIASQTGSISTNEFEIPIQNEHGLIPNHLEYGGSMRVSRRFVTFNPLVNDITQPIDINTNSTRIIIKNITTMLKSSAKNILIESNNGELFERRVKQAIGNVTSRLAVRNDEVRQIFVSNAVQAVEDMQLQLKSPKSKARAIADLKNGLNTIRQISGLRNGNTSVITLDLETLNSHVDSPQLAAHSAFTKIWQYGIVVTDSTGVSKDIRQVSSNHIITQDAKLSKLDKMLKDGISRSEIQRYIDADTALYSYGQYVKSVTGHADMVEAYRDFIRDINIRGAKSNIKDDPQMAISIKNTLASMIAAEKAQGKRVLLSSFNGARFDIQILAKLLNTNVKSLARDLGLTSSDLIDVHQAKKTMFFGDINDGSNSLAAVVKQMVLGYSDLDFREGKMFDEHVLQHMDDDTKKLLAQVMPDKVLIPGKLAHNNAAYDAAMTVRVMHALGDHYGKFDVGKQASFIRFVESLTSGKSEDLINRFLQIQGATFKMDGRMLKASLSGLSSNQTSRLIFGLVNVGAIDPFMALNPLNKDLHQFNRNIWIRKDRLNRSLVNAPLESRNYLNVRDMYIPHANAIGNAFTNKLQMDTIFTFNTAGSHSGTAVFTRDAFNIGGYTLKNVAMTDIINDADQHNNIKQIYSLILKRAKKIAEAKGTGITGQDWEQASQEVIAKSNSITTLNRTGVRLRTDDRTIQHRGQVEIVGVHFRHNNNAAPTENDISLQIMLHENAYTGQIAWNAGGRKIVADRANAKSAEIATRQFGITEGVMAQEQLEFLSKNYYGSMKQMMVEKAITILQRRIQNGDKAAEAQLKKLATHYNNAAPELAFKYNAVTKGLKFGADDLLISTTDTINSVSKLNSRVLMDALAIAGHEAVFTYDTLSMYYGLNAGKMGSFKDNYVNGKGVINGYIENLEMQIDKTIASDIDLKNISGAGADQKHLLKYLDPMSFIEEHYNAKFKEKHGGKSFKDIFFSDRNAAENIIASANVPIFLQALPDINNPNNKLGQLGVWAPGLTRTAYNQFTGKNVKSAAVKLNRTWLDQIQGSPHLNFSWVKNIFHYNLGMNRTRRARDAYRRVKSYKGLFNDTNIATGMLHVGTSNFDNTFNSLLDTPESTKLLKEQISSALRSNTIDKIPVFNMSSLQFTDLLLSHGVGKDDINAFKLGDPNPDVLTKIDNLVQKKLRNKAHASDVIDYVNTVGKHNMIAVELKGGVNVGFDSLLSSFEESEGVALSPDKVRKLFSENHSGVISMNDGRIKMTSAVLLPFRTMSSYMGNVKDMYGSFSSPIKEEVQLLTAIKKLNTFQGTSTERANHEQDVAFQWLKYIAKSMSFSKKGIENQAMHKTLIPGTQLMYRSHEATMIRVDSLIQELTSGEMVSGTESLLKDLSFKDNMSKLFSADAYKELYVGNKIDPKAALKRYLENIKSNVHGHTAIMNAESFMPSGHTGTPMIQAFNDRVGSDIDMNSLFVHNRLSYDNGFFGVSTTYATIEDKKRSAVGQELRRVARGESTLPGAVFVRHPHIQSGVNPGTVGDIALVQGQIAEILGVNKDIVYMGEIMGDLQKADSDTDLIQVILRGFKSMSDIDQIRKDTVMSNKMMLEKNIFFQESMKLYNASNYVRKQYVKDGVAKAGVSQLIIDPTTGLAKYAEKEMNYNEAFYGFGTDNSGNIVYHKTGKTSGLASMSEVEGILQSTMSERNTGLIDRHLANESVGAIGKNLIGVFTNTVRNRIHDLYYMNPGLRQNADLLLGFIGDLDHGLTNMAQAPVSGLKHKGIDEVVKLTELLDGLRSPGSVDSKKYEDLKDFFVNTYKDSDAQKQAEKRLNAEKQFKMLFTRMAGFEHIKRLDPEFAEQNRINFGEAVGQNVTAIDVAYNDRVNKLLEVDTVMDKWGAGIRDYMGALNEYSNNYQPGMLEDLVPIGRETYEDVLSKQLKTKFGSLGEHPIVQGLKKSKKGAAAIGLAYLGVNFFRPMQMSESWNPADGFIDVGSTVDSQTKFIGSGLELDRSVPLDTINASFSKETFVELNQYSPHKYKKARAPNLQAAVKAANRDSYVGTHGFKGDTNVSYTVLTSQNAVFGSSDLDRRLRMINQGVE